MTLVIGKAGKTAVVPLVERASRFVVLVPLAGRDMLTVGDAVIAAAGTLPPQLAKSLTWDCGAEMAGHARITAAGLPVYFARPHSAWQRGSNENANRIPCEYFPKGVPMSRWAGTGPIARLGAWRSPAPGAIRANGSCPFSPADADEELVVLGEGAGIAVSGKGGTDSAVELAESVAEQLWRTPVSSRSSARAV